LNTKTEYILQLTREMATTPSTGPTVLAADNTTQIAPFPNIAAANWSQDDPTHPGVPVEKHSLSGSKPNQVTKTPLPPSYETSTPAWIKNQVQDHGTRIDIARVRSSSLRLSRMRRIDRSMLLDRVGIIS
jgi:hypothetical protein